jgi:hypothetical protein
MSTKLKAMQNKENMKLLPQATTTEKPKDDPQPQATPPNPEKQEREIIALLNPTPEQRILNARNFQILSDKYERLKDKQDDLNVFGLSSDGSQDKFRLSNSAGSSFEFSNTEVIEEVIAVVTKHLEKRLQDTKKQILEFVI